MDPQANLMEQLQVSQDIEQGINIEANAQRLAELVIALNAWIQNGGFLPSDWR